MSRVGNLPIAVPAGVAVEQRDGLVHVKGPKGQLSAQLVQNIEMKHEDGELIFTRTSNSKPAKASHGLMRALVGNMVIGVTKGFSKKLEVHGVGYRAEVRGKQLVLNLGYSHPVEFNIPEGIAIEADKTNKITVSGIDKQKVGQVAAEIRDFRKPDHYKGKGVRYEGEQVRLKAGKSA